MRDFKTRQFGSHTYTCQPLPAMAALRLSVDLAANLGSEIVAVLTGAADGDDGSDPEVAAKRIEAAGLGGLMYRLQEAPPEFVETTIRRILAGTFVMDTSTNPPTRSPKSLAETFDQHFVDPGCLRSAMQIVSWSLEVNFQQAFGKSQ